MAVVLNDRMEYFVDVDYSVGRHCSKSTQKRNVCCREPPQLIIVQIKRVDIWSIGIRRLYAIYQRVIVSPRVLREGSSAVLTEVRWKAPGDPGCRC